MPGYTWDAGLKSTGIESENNQDADLFLILENAIRSGISDCMGKIYVLSVVEKIIDKDSYNLYGLPRS